MKDILKAVVIGGLFLVPLLTFYVENDFFFPYITGKNFAFRIIVEVVLASWIVLAFSNPIYRPRKSWLITAFASFLVIMLGADLLGQHSDTSIWGNYERMDGYVTLVHVFAYFVVLGTMLQTPKIWSYFLHTSVAMAIIVAFIGLAQLGKGVGRVDSQLGNAAYMAVYMLFQVFIVAYLFVQAKSPLQKLAYVLIAMMFLYVLLQTGTRGTAIGFAVGAIVTVGYIAIFSTRYPQIRKYALGSFVALILMAGAFVGARDTAYIQNTPALARIANIDLGNDLAIRSIIWGMAIEGVKERPIIGWGQGNFNYVFNAEYDPRLYAQEQWFDRVHNIVLDWLIAGGVLGLLAYFSIFAALFYYLFIRPFFYHDESFTVLERGVLVGLIAGYLTHNLVVFDNIVSYIFFAIILALIHSRVSQEIPKLAKAKCSDAVINQVILPTALAATLLVVYLVNVPSMLAAGDIIKALRSPSPSERYDYFETAFNRGSFANQEIVEQFAQQTVTIEQAQSGVSDEIKAKYRAKAKLELDNMLARKPGDARLYVFAASYYRSINDLATAETMLKEARTLSPKKQTIIIQQAALAINLGKKEEAEELFGEAFYLDERNNDAREYYVASLFNNGSTTEAMQLAEEAPVEFKAKVALSDFYVGAVNNAKEIPYLAELYEIRVDLASSSPQNWASLAFIYHQLDQDDKAIETLMRAKTIVPSFATTATCIADNLRAGREPQLNCN